MNRHISKNPLLIVLLSLLCLLSVPGDTLSQTSLVIEGNVVGYELNTVHRFGTIVLPEYPVLVKTTKIIEGKEQSKYVIVLLKFLDKEYAEQNFGLNKITTFNLERRINYSKKIKHLLYSGDTLENGKVVKTAQTFKFVAGIEKADLPLKENIPCYVEIE